MNNNGKFSGLWDGFCVAWASRELHGVVVAFSEVVVQVASNWAAPKGLDPEDAAQDVLVEFLDGRLRQINFDLSPAEGWRYMKLHAAGVLADLARKHQCSQQDTDRRRIKLNVSIDEYAGKTRLLLEKAVGIENERHFADFVEQMNQLGTGRPASPVTRARQLRARFRDGTYSDTDVALIVWREDKVLRHMGVGSFSRALADVISERSGHTPYITETPFDPQDPNHFI